MEVGEGENVGRDDVAIERGDIISASRAIKIESGADIYYGGT